MASSRIGTGLDPKLLAPGLGIVGLGVVTACVGWFTNVELRILALPIPLGIVGPLVVLLGVAMVADAFHQQKCLACNAPLESTLVHFPLEWTPRVVAAVMNGDAFTLHAAPMGHAYENHVKVRFHPCPSCKSVALLEVEAFEPARRRIVPKRALEGAAVKPVADILSAREAAAQHRAE